VEEYFSAQNKSPFTMKILYEDDIKANSVISQKLDELSVKDNQPNTSARQIYNPEYNFNVNTDYSKYIESSDGSIHSYTFLIERAEYNELEENLVLTSQPNGSYKAEIISYKRISDNQLGMKTTPLENFNTSEYTSARTNTQISCTTTLTFLSTPIPGCNCSQEVLIDASTDCSVQYFLSPNIDGSTGGSSSSSCGPGGGSPLNNTIIEVITTGDGNTETPNVITSPIIESHIDKLTKQTNNNLIKARIIEMHSGLNTATKEQGSEFRKINNNNNVPFVNEYEEYPIPENQTTFSGVYFPPAQANTEVLIHPHNNTPNPDNPEEYILPFFSVEDIALAPKFYYQKKQAIPPNTLIRSDYYNISSILVTQNKIFALRILDSEKALAFNQNIFSGMSDGIPYSIALKDAYIENIIENTKNYCEELNCDQSAFNAIAEAYFILHFSSISHGLGLFEAEYNEIDNSIGKWSLVTTGL